MATAVVNALNGTAPERTPTINVTNVAYTSLGANVVDVYITGRGNPGDPPAGGNTVVLRHTPVSGAPLAIYFGGLRQVANVDYSISGTSIIFTTATFDAGNTVVADYWVTP